ncbi:hypothetical protein JQ628_30490 [Bradyrhizobium lablabi]|uniref:hypothetical protein n=1 Tax=Bradyrhizobium lablabi TaxID=722472 RepID=UPI001BA62B00|nr:hypothetical protein [Bradyrhizobium lablabi]MBR1125888.1 hypothetical protein [Bradyrhizobium lablabi]
MKAKPVFVLDRPARRHWLSRRGWTEAAALAQSIWFNEAAGKFPAVKESSCAIQGGYRVRAATSIEADIYRQLCEEFDGPTRQLLVANLSGFLEGTSEGPAKSRP